MADFEEKTFPQDSQIGAPAHAHIASHGPQATVQALSNEHDPPSPTINVLCRQFLQDVKLQFGEPSPESSAIHHALDEFFQSVISKRETITIINNTLRTHTKLEHDLMAIFNHRDARWSPGDFDSSGVPNHKHSEQLPGPSFLQPPHQPTISLPPVFSLVSNEAHRRSSLDPFSVGKKSHHPTAHPVIGLTGEHWLRESHEVTDIDQNQTLSPIHLHEQARPAAFGRDMPRPVISHNTNGPYQEGNFLVHHAQSPAFSLRQHTLDHDSSGKAHTGLEWDDGSMSMPNQARTSTEEHSPSSTLRESDMRRHSNMALGHTAMPAGLPMVGPTEPAEASKYKAGASQKPAIGLSSETPTTANLIPAQKDSIAVNGSFIHALCGKAFSSRSKVKKHHWGNMLNDLETTTGCWAKHNKPNVNWDDDPSCKPAPPKVFSAKRKSMSGAQSQKSPKVHSTEQKALPAPAMVPQSSTTDQRVSVQPRTPAPMPSPNVQFHGEGYENGNTLLYHSHRLPSLGSMDNLLTVVHYEICAREAPKPQVWNESIISNLDAQASATPWDDQVHHSENWIVPPHTPTPVGSFNSRLYPTFPIDSNSNIDVQEPLFILSSPYWADPRSHLVADPDVLQHDSTLSPLRNFEHAAATSHRYDRDALPMRELSISPESSPRRKKRRTGNGEGAEEVIVAQENGMTGVHFR